jgi:hypothetical protein
MSARLRKWKRVWASFSGAALLAAADSTAFGQVPCEAFPPTHWTPAPQVVPSPYCPPAQPFQAQPQPQPSPTPPSPTPPSPTPTPTPETPAPANVDFEARAGAGAGESFALAPNMIGNLLNASRSIRFGLTRTNGGTDFLGLGSTSITNAAVAENESPVPEDRVYFRYNYYNNALSVTGISPQTSTIMSPAGQTITFQLPQTKVYDVNQYTFGAEKTFFGGLMSAEIRVPFSTTLANRNTLSVGNPTGFVPGATDGLGNTIFNVATTPQNSLGHEDTEFGNLSFIFKSLLFQSECFALSAGFSTGVPSAQDSETRLIDFAGNTAIGMASLERERDILIHNNTWALSPFLAGLYTPTDRWFIQGFAQVEFPLNSSRITYTDAFLQGSLPPGTPPIGPSNLQLPFTATDHIREQTLLHLDLGTGYWIKRDPTAAWITGIAPTVEIHWTSTLNNAQVVNLPGANLFQIQTANGIPVINPGDGAFQQLPETGPQVGSDRNRVDIVDLTLGATFEIANRATVAAAVTLPLRGGDNRTFDYEIQLQLNYYFGCPRGRRVPEAPPSF